MGVRCTWMHRGRGRNDFWPIFMHCPEVIYIPPIFCDSSLHLVLMSFCLPSWLLPSLLCLNQVISASFCHYANKLSFSLSLSLHSSSSLLVSPFTATSLIFSFLANYYVPVGKDNQAIAKTYFAISFIFIFIAAAIVTMIYVLRHLGPQQLFNHAGTRWLSLVVEAQYLLDWVGVVAND